MLNPITAAGTATAIVIAAPAMASSPISEKIGELLAWTENAEGADVRAELGDRLAELTTAHPIETWSLQDMNAMPAEILLFGEGLADQVVERAESFADDKSAEGAASKSLLAYVRMYQDREPPSPEAFKELLSHPGMDAALANGSAARAFDIAGIMGQFMPPYALRPVRGELEGMAKHIKPGMPASAVISAGNYFDGMASIWGDEPEKVDALRGQLIETMRAARTKTKDGGYLAGQLDGKLKQFTFIGSQAPELTFDWTSSGLDAKSLSDLKGQVVVIDFWATWCGPCIAAFPKVREMVEHYDGYPVTVIGVTSLQGSHITEEKQRISTEGDPQKEYELMATLMGDLEITWDVAFSSQEVFNPDYFVQGIPHVAIIAPDGTVRFNGLNPHSLEPGEEVQMIDGLLKEFGLPVPGAG